MFKILCAGLAALILASCGGGGGEVTSTGAATPVPLRAATATSAALRAAPATMAPLRAATTDLLVQSDFESGMGDWTDWGNSQVVDAAGASGSLRALRVGTAAGGAGNTTSGVIAGAAYRLTAQVKVSDPSEVAYLGFYFLDASGAKIAEQAVPVSGTAYAFTTVDITAPASAYMVVVYVWKNAGSGYAFVDDVTLARQAAPATEPANLLSNAGFDIGMTHWVDWGNASIDATPALRVGTAAGGAAQEVAGIVGGATYRLTGQVKVSAPSEDAYLGVYFVDAAGTKVAERMVPVSSTDYMAATVEITAPANAAKAVVYVWKNAGTGYVYVDDLVLARMDASTAPPTAANLLSNPGFESAMAGWIDWGNSLAVTGEAHSGMHASRVGSAAGGFGQYVDGIVPGTSYRLSSASKVSDAAEVVYLGVSFFDAAGTKLAEQNVHTSSTSYVALTLDVVTPANTSVALVYVWKNAGSGYAYADDIVFVRPSVAGTGLVPNGGFESGLANWHPVSDDVVFSDATIVTDAGSGMYAVRVGVIGGVIQFVELVPGQRYRLSAQVKVSDPSVSASVGVRAWAADGANVLEQAITFYYTGATGYSTAHTEFVVPMSAAQSSGRPTNAVIFVQKDSAGAGFIYADNISLVPL